MRGGGKGNGEEGKGHESGEGSKQGRKERLKRKGDGEIEVGEGREWKEKEGGGVEAIG